MQPRDLSSVADILVAAQLVQMFVAGADRDILIHDYDDMDLDQVWNVATVSLPELIRQIEPLVPPEEQV